MTGQEPLVLVGTRHILTISPLLNLFAQKAFVSFGAGRSSIGRRSSARRSATGSGRCTAAATSVYAFQDYH